MGRGDAELVDHRGQRRGVVDEPAADLIGDRLGGGVGERGALAAAAGGPRGQLAALVRPHPPADEVGVEVVEAPGGADRLGLQHGHAGRQLLHPGLADDRLERGGVGRVGGDEQQVAVGLRGEQVRDLVGPDGRGGDLGGLEQVGLGGDGQPGVGGDQQEPAGRGHALRLSGRRARRAGRADRRALSRGVRGAGPALTGLIRPVAGRDPYRKESLQTAPGQPD